MTRICKNNQAGKEEKQVRCPYCASQLVIRYGIYPRAHPHRDEEIRVQRYLCTLNTCLKVTFSLLPYPFLRVIRHFYMTVLDYHCALGVAKLNQAALARKFGVTRGVAKRLALFCARFIPWLNREKLCADWGPAPETDPQLFWPDFLRDFSHSQYPGKWASPQPT